MLKRRGKKGIYEVRFTAPNGQPLRRSTGTANKRLAQEFEAKLRTELWRVAKLGDKPRRTWQEAAVQWLETRAGKDTIEKDRANLRWLDLPFGDLFLDEIDETRIAAVSAARLAEPANKKATATPKTPAHKRRPESRAGAPVALTKPATVNRMLSLIGAIFRAARDQWKWVNVIPVVAKLPEKMKEVPTITRDMMDALFAELPDHLASSFRFSLATGLRDQNVLRLRWKYIDIARAAARIPGDETKGETAIAVPLNADALAVLNEQAAKLIAMREALTDKSTKEERKIVAGASEWCFPSPSGLPYTRSNNTAWRNARARAGMPWMRWHDLRHAWASWHAQAGTSALALKELGGWSSLAMVERYTSFAVDHLAEHAKRIETSPKVRANSGPSKKL